MFRLPSLGEFWCAALSLRRLNVKNVVKQPDHLAIPSLENFFHFDPCWATLPPPSPTANPSRRCTPGCPRNCGQGVARPYSRPRRPRVVLQCGLPTAVWMGCAAQWVVPCCLPFTPCSDGWGALQGMWRSGGRSQRAKRECGWSQLVIHWRSDHRSMHPLQCAE